jgi:hypothetical protein
MKNSALASKMFEAGERARSKETRFERVCPLRLKARLALMMWDF